MQKGAVFETRQHSSGSGPNLQGGVPNVILLQHSSILNQQLYDGGVASTDSPVEWSGACALGAIGLVHVAPQDLAKK